MKKRVEKVWREKGKCGEENPCLSGMENKKGDEGLAEDRRKRRRGSGGKRWKCMKKREGGEKITRFN